jgi:ABC-type multidrug transport system fused ATPase/permease subunit
LISNVVEDVNYANMFFRKGFMLLIESVAYIAISYIIIFVICPVAAVAFMGMLLLGVLTVVVYFKYGHDIYARSKSLYEKTVRIFTENMEGYLIVKGFGASVPQLKKYDKAVDELHSAQIRESLFSAYLSQMMAIITLLGIPLVIGVALYEARAGRWEFTAGRLFLLFYLQTGIRMKAWGLSRALEMALRFTITSERLGRLLDSDSYLDDKGTEPVPESGVQLDLENVSFSYGRGDHSLHDVSLSIAKGSTIALVGATGSGKTTLALLLCRFYDPAAGVIMLNGCDLKNYNLKELRNRFSLVFQDTFLFSASIRDNIIYGRPDAGFEDVVHAATVAGIHEHIMNMPEGYDTVVGERGVTLSGGQRQRISIARAILRKPDFLILDACTSALDIKTEKAIQESLSSLRGSTTSVIIAHRFSSIERVDKVYVLQDGRIVESGTPQELNVPGSVFNRVMKS